MDSTKRPRREKVLVLIRRETPGRPYAEVYAENHVDCRIVNVPFVGTNAGECMAEDFVRESLPWCYRELLLPGNVRATSMVTLTRPSEIADRIHHRELLRALDTFEQTLAAEPEEVLEWA